MEIRTTNVNHMLEELFWRFRDSGVETNTRNGRALVIEEPVILTYSKPWQRVLFSAERDANPIFHLMECIWIMAGREGVQFLEQFNSTIRQYSDDGHVFNAAYGRRIRSWFGFDQLYAAIDELRIRPESRQAVVQIWDPKDLRKDTKDKACNMIILFAIVNKKLNMTVMNRSNDLWWGACGANAVHFSFLQEVVAGALGRQIGEYFQISNNMHMYLDLYDAQEYLDHPSMLSSPEAHVYNQMEHYPLLSGVDHDTFIEECEHFTVNPFAYRDYESDFLNDVAQPMACVSLARKAGEDGLRHCERIKATDWRIATTQWATRREEARNAA